MVEALKSILFQQKLDRRCKTQGTGAETALLLEHRNRTWDSILVQTNRSILLTGIGVYSPQGGAEKVISVDARPFVDPLRPLDVETKLSSEFEDGSKKAISIFAKVPFVINANCLWEVALNISASHNTFTSGTIWSQSGSFNDCVERHGTCFTFTSTERGDRKSVV